MFSLFAHITPVYLLYLFYGASFLFLGVSIATKEMKGSELKLADSLWMLGVFGFLHGFHEWMKLGQLIEGKNLSLRQMISGEGISVVLLVLSFLFLLQFGISLIRGLDAKQVRWVKGIPAPLLLIWVLYVWHYGFHKGGLHLDLEFLRQVDIGARFTFGLVGGMLAAYSLIAYSREVRVLSPSAAKNLFYTGITFIFYTVFTSSYFVPMLPIPVELLRGTSAFVIACFIAKALNIFDVESRKKIEQQMRRLVQAEKLASLGQLAAGIAHEINNPLANASLGIQTLKSRLRTNEAGGEVVERLDAVERNIDQASSIAQELLQFSRQQETGFVPLNIHTVIQGALALMQYKLATVAVRKDLEPVPEIMGDPGKLQQVFINVLANSVEAMPDGGSISLATSTRGETVFVRIKDTGIGIEAENLSRVFDPFFSTKEIGSGTGLGLSICYGILRRHGGTIEVASAIGKGTEVTIKLPVRKRDEKDTDR